MSVIDTVDISLSYFVLLSVLYRVCMNVLCVIIKNKNINVHTLSIHRSTHPLTHEVMQLQPYYYHSGKRREDWTTLLR